MHGQQAVSPFQTALGRFSILHGDAIDLEHANTPHITSWLRAVGSFAKLQSSNGRCSWLTRDVSSGEILALGTLPTSGTAFIDRFDSVYFVSVSIELILCTFELAAGLWSNRLFCPWIGDISQLDPHFSSDYTVPRGLDRVYHSEVNRESWGRYDESNLAVPRWLIPAILSLCPTRSRAFERTVLAAHRFILLHEIAHAELGHVDFIKSKFHRLLYAESNDQLSGSGARKAAESLIPWRSFEIEADRIAMDSIFRRVYSGTTKKRREILQAGWSDEIVIPTTALLLFPLILHARNEIAVISAERREDQLRQHPPLWYRAAEVLKAGSKASALKAASGDHGMEIGHATMEAIRLQHELRLRDAIRSICDCHALFGQWFGAILFNEEQEERESADVLRAAKAEFAIVRERLTALRKGWRIVAV